MAQAYNPSTYEQRQDCHCSRPAWPCPESRLARATLNQPTNPQARTARYGGTCYHPSIWEIQKEQLEFKTIFSKSSRPVWAIYDPDSKDKTNPVSKRKMKNKIRAKKQKSVYTVQEATLLFMHAEFYLTEMALGRLKAQKLKQNFFGTIYKVMTSLFKNLGSPLALCKLNILLILITHM